MKLVLSEEVVAVSKLEVYNALEELVADVLLVSVLSVAVNVVCGVVSVPVSEKGMSKLLSFRAIYHFISHSW